MAPSTAQRQDELAQNLRRRVGDLLHIGQAPNDLALADRVEAGVPASAVESLVGHGVPEPFVFKTIVPRRTYQRRRERDEPLSAEESDRAERVARMLALATIVFDDEERAARWLAAPKHQFDDRAPFALLRTKIGADVVERALLQSYFGLAA
jgi:putative toxin-antitoxin system antitoxin component (TIGR02293 family)